MRRTAIVMCLVLTSCAAALPFIAAAVAVADRAAEWIDRVEAHAEPLIAAVDAATAQRVVDAIRVARAATAQVRERGKAAERGDYESALDGLEAALSELFAAGRPLGVEQVPAGLLGAQRDGVLGVPPPREIVRGAE